MRSIITLAMLIASLAFATATGTLAQDASPAASPAADTASCPDMTADDAATLANTFLETMNARDFAGLAGLLAPDYVHHWAFGNDSVGAEAYVAGLEALVAVFPDLHLTATDIITSDDLAVIAFEASGTQTQPFLGFPASEQPATWSGLFVHRIACGKIADSWTEADHLSRLRQQGAIPGPEATPEP